MYMKLHALSNVIINSKRTRLHENSMDNVEDIFCCTELISVPRNYKNNQILVDRFTYSLTNYEPT